MGLDRETRAAIVRRKAAERGHTLAPEVCDALARLPFVTVRELEGALERILAVQELEDRTVSAGEVGVLLGSDAPERGPDEFREFLADLTGTVDAVVLEAARGRDPAPKPPEPWRLSREKALWEWPYVEDWIEESLD